MRGRMVNFAGKEILILKMERKNIVISEMIHSKAPSLRVGVLLALFANKEHCPELEKEMRMEEKRIASLYTPDTVKLIPGVEATRRAYKACGKDPSRYRPSNEQLARRVVTGKMLWSVNTAVDIGNLASLKSGYSIGCFDYDSIEGTDVTLGIGREGEPYEGIGRGPLNIAGLPVYRDALGGIGTPTSDNERTKITLSTTRMLALVNGYDGDVAAVQQTLSDMAAAFNRYLDARCESFLIS